jgi:hypothetical protein
MSDDDFAEEPVPEEDFLTREQAEDDPTIDIDEQAEEAPLVELEEE